MAGHQGWVDRSSQKWMNLEASFIGCLESIHLKAHSVKTDKACQQLAYLLYLRNMMISLLRGIIPPIKKLILLFTEAISSRENHFLFRNIEPKYVNTAMQRQRIVLHCECKPFGLGMSKIRKTPNLTLLTCLTYTAPNKSETIIYMFIYL